MANYSAQKITRTGIAPTYHSAASGDKATPGDRVFLHVKNGDSASHNITIATVGTADGLTISNLVVAVPATSERWIGPIIRPRFADPTDGLAHITWSATTSITFAVATI